MPNTQQPRQQKKLSAKAATVAVFSLALLPDGLRFVSGSHDKTARIIEIGSLP